MPTTRAVKKWPASWIRIKKPRPRIAIRVLMRLLSCRLEPSLGDAARGGVGLHELVQVACRSAVRGGERLLDDLGDAEERQAAVEERGHGDLVRGVERAGVGAASLPCLAGEGEEGEGLE